MRRRYDNPYDPDPPADPNKIASIAGIPFNGYLLVRFHDFENVELTCGATELKVLVPVKKLDALIAALSAARAQAVRIGTLDEVSPVYQSASHVSRPVSRAGDATPQDPSDKLAEAQRLHEENVSRAEIAKRLGVSRATVYRWLKPAQQKSLSTH